MNILILAGGFGERLWPVSSKEFPKQFMALDQGLSFIQLSLERALLLEPKGSIFIVTRQDILQTTVEQCKTYAQTLSSDDKKRLEQKLIVIAEPCQKHTAPPMALVCRYIQSLGNEKEPLLVLTSDHIIHPFEQFKNDVQKAVIEAKKNRFMCFLIPPTEPATGFGYIQVSKTDEKEVFSIDLFKEKPDLETAKQYLKDGNFWWNSGMFCVLPTVFMNELTIHSPNLVQSFLPIALSESPYIEDRDGIQTISTWQYMINSYEKATAISVDHALAEKTDKAFAIKTCFGWHDIGTWDSFANQFTDNNESNVTVGNVAQSDCKNCFVYSDAPVVLCGVEDLLVTVKDGNVLIMKKGSSELIKETVKKLD